MTEVYRANGLTAGEIEARLDDLESQLGRIHGWLLLGMRWATEPDTPGVASVTIVTDGLRSSAEFVDEVTESYDAAMDEYRHLLAVRKEAMEVYHRIFEMRKAVMEEEFPRGAEGVEP
jgi:hypothetical protein